MASTAQTSADGAEYVTLDRAAVLVAVPAQTLRQWIREGRLAAFKPGRRVLLRPVDLRALVERSRVGGPSR